jgi:hypothetical protein
MEKIIGQTHCTSIDHDTQPSKTTIPQALINAASTLNERIPGAYLPYFQARAENSISHWIYMVGSTQARESWPHGYIENSPYFKASISPGRQWTDCNESERYEVDFFSYNSALRGKLRGRKHMTLAQAFVYVEKQISKLK